MQKNAYLQGCSNPGGPTEEVAGRSDFFSDRTVVAACLRVFCEHLETLELWPEPPEWHGALRFRQWASESAALDLALRQAGHSLHDVLGLEPQPVRFVNSLGLGKEPSIEPLRRRLARSPGRALQARRGGDL